MTLIDTALGLSADALKLRAQRLDVIAGNIANASTPGYKARDIDADAALARLQAARSGGFGDLLADQLAGGQIRNRAAMVPSLDGNTVQMATEQAAFAENAVRYRASLGFLTGRIQTIMSALKGGE